MCFFIFLLKNPNILYDNSLCDHDEAERWQRWLDGDGRIMVSFTVLLYIIVALSVDY